MNYQSGIKQKSEREIDCSNIKILNSEKSVYSKDRSLANKIKSNLSSRDINLTNDRQLIKLDKDLNIAHFKDSEGKIHKETYDAIFVDTPVKQNSLTRKL